METMSPLADRMARMRFHKAVRQKGIAAKACSRCFTVKALTQYGPASNTTDHRQAYCEECVTSYRVANRQRDAAQQARHRASDPAAARVRERASRQRRRPAEAARTAAWRLANPEKRRLYEHARRARKAASTVVPFSMDDMLADWEEHDLYACAFCGGPFEDIDHLMPLSRGGEHSIANIVPSCFECNRGIGGKHARDPWEWLAERFPALAPILIPDVDEPHL